MKSRLQQNLEGNWENYIFPFFWQSGNSQEEILIELEKIYDCGIRAVCVEARPHPDYGGPRWWRDMDLIMDFAREREMKVWLLDDDRFPTGHCNKAFSDEKNPLSVRFLTVHNTDVKGPLTPGYMLIKSLLAEDDELIGVIACRRKEESTKELILDSAVDITSFVENGWLCWDIPEGLWRILVFYTTRKGNGKLDYFNIIDSDSVKILLEQVYEPHYAHYGKDFGSTFQGFFSDEPEFSNLPGYNFQARLGEDMPFIPWSKELFQRLKGKWGDDFLRNLPALWYECGKKTSHIRYEYMNEVTKQLETAFSKQIQNWCKTHHVKHIGHIVEDDNSHGRLGCSTGHYFRSIGSMDMAGVDVVTQQIMPGMDQGEHQWVASSRDGEFFHYGLGKLASSLAHIDVGKKGNSMCEIFGAFGWQEGLGLMKWLTDHMISRGVNHFTPHAFSLKPYPDSDCPPHFYAHGNQPQYRDFGHLMNYMNRLSHLFSGGIYPARIAVLYHADAEWAGEVMLYQKPVKEMQQNQIECDVIPADLLEKNNSYGAIFKDGIYVAGQHYQILLIPGCKYIPLSVTRFILEEKNNTKCIFVGRLPEGICDQTEEEEELIQKLSNEEMVPLSQLAGRVRELCTSFVETEREFPKLCIYPYIEKDGTAYIFFFNEDIKEEIHCRIKIRYGTEEDELLYYDVFHNRCFHMKSEYKDSCFQTEIHVEPGESFVLVVKKKEENFCTSAYCVGRGEIFETAGKWEISYQDVQETEWHTLKEISEEEKFPDVTPWLIKEGFSGILAYETILSVSKKQAGRYKMCIFGKTDSVDIFINGKYTDTVIGSPSYADVFLEKGENILRLELPLTPVWRDGDPWSSLTVLSSPGLKKRPTFIKYEEEEHERETCI